MKINKDRTYDIEGSNGIITVKGSQITEALKDNGIPVDLPDPPEVDGCGFEVVNRDSKIKGGERYNMANHNLTGWCYKDGATNNHPFYPSPSCVCIRYIPNPVEEMTLTQVCTALGKNIKIIK